MIMHVHAIKFFPLRQRNIWSPLCALPVFEYISMRDVQTATCRQPFVFSKQACTPRPKDLSPLDVQARRMLSHTTLSGFIPATCMLANTSRTLSGPPCRLQTSIMAFQDTSFL
uniref:Uncharacterized protein n=1 Tax=Arundo donax TaxID=35708 RepID=A0A0A8ZI38_ARUDO